MLKNTLRVSNEKHFFLCGLQVCSVALAGPVARWARAIVIKGPIFAFDIFMF